MNLQEAQDAYHRLRIRRAIENFRRRRFEAMFFETAKEATTYFFSVPKPTDVIE